MSRSQQQQQSADATPATAVTAATSRTPMLMRACDCGRSAPGPSGQCASCAVEDRLGPGPHVTLGPADDAYEQQADRIADRVVSAGPASDPAGECVTRLQRQTMEEEELLQPKPDRLQRQEEEEEDLLQMNPERVQRQEEDQDLLQLKAAYRVVGLRLDGRGVGRGSGRSPAGAVRSRPSSSRASEPTCPMCVCIRIPPPDARPATSVRGPTRLAGTSPLRPASTRRPAATAAG